MKDAKMLKTLGIDTEQARKIGGSFENVSAVSVAAVPNRSDNAGYFKLVKWDGNKSALDDSKRAPVLIVSFGSAPGVPNWGGLLKKLRKKEVNLLRLRVLQKLKDNLLLIGLLKLITN